MDDEYKVVCALSNGATFDDLEWPWTPVSRLQYSLKANISQTVHLIQGSDTRVHTQKKPGGFFWVDPPKKARQ